MSTRFPLFVQLREQRRHRKQSRFKALMSMPGKNTTSLTSRPLNTLWVGAMTRCVQSAAESPRRPSCLKRIMMPTHPIIHSHLTFIILGRHSSQFVTCVFFHSYASALTFRQDYFEQMDDLRPFLARSMEKEPSAPADAGRCHDRAVDIHRIAY